MASPVTYGFAFNVDSGGVPGTVSVSPAGSAGYTVADGVDGDGDNDSTAPGQSIDWTVNGLGTGPYTLIGVTSNGEPVIQENGGAQYVLSDNGMPGGSFSTTSSAYSYCFSAGTMIAAPSGEIAVEKLEIGDEVLTAEGNVVPVKWIGRQTVRKLFSGANMEPVRIQKGVFGGGLPNADLTITADHGMVVDGLLINASALINGTTIDWVPMAELSDQVTYYHVETEAHDVILANGVPAETFIDYAGRQAFDNYQEYVDLFGAERIIPEMDRPRISAARLVPDAIKARLGIVEPEIDWDAPLSA